jgi:hypothetical protein
MTIDRAPFNPPLPGHKPAIPAPTRSAAAQPRTPLPERKPDPSVVIAAGTPLPGRKPAAQAAIASTADSKAAAVPTGPAAAAAQVGEAIRAVAGLSGHSFSTLLAQASQESGLDPKARSRTSSAAGPFQFVERTWLDMVRRHGASYGLGDLASGISVKDGVPVVKDAALKRRILDLREDPHISAGMAARHLAEGREALSKRLKRPVTEIESRIAYVMGVGGATRLLQAAVKSPDMPARDLLPQAARANRPLFHDESGRALGVRDMIARLSQRMQSDAMRLGSLEEEPTRRDDAPAGTAPGALLFAQEAGREGDAA